MPSAAEQLAANFNFSAFSKATELKKRLLFTALALIVVRLGTYIPMPGIDATAMAQQLQQQQGSILDVFNVLAGGAIERMAIFALGIMPYISASIIMQLMTAVSPHLEQLKKEGEAGRKVMNQYTRYGTVALAAVQAYAIAVGLENWGTAVIEPGMAFRMSAVITLTGGTIPVADLLRLSFEFLLDREPKESILRRFELPVIARYFPEYEQAMKHRIAAE